MLDRFSPLFYLTEGLCFERNGGVRELVYVFINLFYSHHLVAKMVKMVSRYGPETLQG